MHRATATLSPLARSRATTEGSIYASTPPVPLSHRRLGTVGFFCRGVVAEGGRRVRRDRRAPSTCWRCCRRRGGWCARAWPPIIRRSSRSARNSRRPPGTPGSGSSATSWWANTCERRRTRRALRRGDLRRRRAVRPRRLGFRARTCRAASPRSISSAGTTRTRTSRRWRPIFGRQSGRGRQRQRRAGRGSHPDDRSRRAGA